MASSISVTMIFTAWCLVFLHIISVTVASPHPPSGEYDDDYSSSIEEPPQFLSASEEFSVEVGGEITFPCQVQHIGLQKLVFEFSSFDEPSAKKMYFAGDTRFSVNKRIHKDDQSFRLNNIQRSDAGQYTCTIYEPLITVQHILRVQYPAKIRRISQERQHVVKGDTVTLQCEAEGNPEPAIQWTKRNSKMRSGFRTEEGLSITLEGVDRHQAGTYACTASNGIGEPSTAQMYIEVEYKPEITTLESILHTGDGDEAKLVCLVHGHPTPEVSWRRGDNLVASDKHIMTHDGEHMHTLIIPRVHDGDFGNYTCSASNIHGITDSTLALTGLPKVPNLTSSPSGGEERTYTLTWETESFAPIIQYRVKYRKLRGQHTKGIPSWIDLLYTPMADRTKHNHQRSSDRIKAMAHAIKKLEPATDYQATVRVENKFGWSSESSALVFHTRKEIADGQSASSGFSSVLSHTGVLAVALLAAAAVVV